MKSLNIGEQASNTWMRTRGAPPELQDESSPGQGTQRGLCKASDRIEAVTHAEYLDDTNKILWH
jgi:hypothetical protein